MTTTTTPEQPANSYRITLNLDFPESRMDNVLLNALRGQTENEKLKDISRSGLKDLFNQKQIIIKGQRAKSSSALAKGTTYVDILGFGE
jgi:23S rRNA-/tRNA-specific pseudouridylate synthase